MAVIGSSGWLEPVLLRAVRPILAGHDQPARQQRRDAVPSLWALVTQLGPPRGVRALQRCSCGCYWPASRNQRV